jgi:hypothetical protein
MSQVRHEGKNLKNDLHQDIKFPTNPVRSGNVGEPGRLTIIDISLQSAYYFWLTYLFVLGFFTRRHVDLHLEMMPLSVIRIQQQIHAESSVLQLFTSVTRYMCIPRQLTYQERNY